MPEITTACPECGRNRGNREPHTPHCSHPRLIRRGVLSISNCLLEGIAFDLRCALPPEHRVIAERPDMSMDLVDWIVEGPHMPETSNGDPLPQVKIIFTDHPVPTRRIVAHWEHLPDAEWEVTLS